MKNRLLSLALALALCLELAVPAMAADVSGADAKTAGAYLQVLKTQIGKYSIQNGADKTGISYAGLQDMDGDGAPELVIVSLIETGIFGDVDFGIWKMQGGNAVRTVDQYLNGRPGAMPKSETRTLTVAFAHKGGQTRLFYDWDNEFLGGWDERVIYRNRFYVFFSADGSSDIQEFSDGADGNHRYEFANYDRSWQVDTTPLLSFDGTQWAYSSKSVSDLQAALTTKANEVPSKPTTSTPAPGTYGPLTVTVPNEYGPSLTVTFSSAVLEKKVIGTTYITGSPADPPATRSEEKIVVTIEYGSKITLPGNSELYSNIGATFGRVENGRYSTGVGADSLYSILENYADFSEINDAFFVVEEDYVFVLGDRRTSPSDPSNPFDPAAPAFRDVPTNAYYAAPVSWAVSKNITNGTSSTAFSPDQTCTQVQILTFLYRAVRNGGTADASDMDKAINWARGKGMIDGGFDGGKPCTRASAVKFI